MFAAKENGTVRNKQNVSTVASCMLQVASPACRWPFNPKPRPNPRERRERHLNGVIIFAPSPGSFGSELIACHIINFRLPPLLNKRLLYSGPGAGLGPTLTCGILTRRNSSEKFQKSCGMLQSCWVLLSPDVWACQGVVA